MFEAWRNWLLRVLRVPPAPLPPEGTPDSVLVFRAGPNFYRWRIVAWAGKHSMAIAGAIGGYFALHQTLRRIPPRLLYLEWLWTGMEAMGILSLAAGMISTFLVLRLDYEMRWYIVTDRSLRIRHGIWSVQELTMTFANIQEIRVNSGPLQNALGLADVVVSAAGGGGTDRHGHAVGGHQAAFEGVANANEIRDLIVERLRIYRDSGLGGDPLRAAAAHAPADTVAAAQQVLQEARALRAVVNSSRA